MGKSAGKWIKTLLYGNKTSKSKRRGEVRRYSIFANEKGILGPPKALEANTVVTQPITSQSDSYNVDRNERKSKLDRKDSDSSQEDTIITPGYQNLKAAESTPEEARYDLENTVLGVAAAKVQATFRGYLARRAFHALKGILRLQALIRGHLVRRQAVATLYCMVGIVKLQAINRGRQIRKSSIGLEVFEICDLADAKQSKLRDPVVDLYTKMANLSGNKFICKLLSSSPTGMPLHLPYGSEDPNSVLIWLERWSASHFWKPVSLSTKYSDPKSRRHLGSGAFGNAEMGRPKRSVRRVPAAKFESVPIQLFAESEKLRPNLRNIPYRPAYLVQENPQLELEKVKRSLRKVHNPGLETSAKTQSEVEKTYQILEKGSSSSGREILESKQDTVKPSDGMVHNTTDQNVSMQKNMSLMVSNFPDVEKALLPLQKIDSFTNSGDELKLVIESIKQDDYIALKNGNAKEESKRKDNQKTSKNAFNALKQDPAENATQKSPTLPSYMAATESAKAKLRLQGSPRLSQDGGEKNSATRHYPLPSGTCNKMRSHSPRTRRSIQGDGKGGNKSDKQPPKDVNARADWRR